MILFGKSIHGPTTQAPAVPRFPREGRRWRGVLAMTALLLAATLAPAQNAHFVVVLDAAHGGNDTGGRLNAAQQGQFLPEKTFTLAFAGRLRSLLAARGIAVTLTRDSDSASGALERAAVANHLKASACLSLHATGSGSGVHLYASSLTPGAASHLNAWKTAQAPYVQRSLALAGTLNAALGHAGVPVTLGRTALPGLDSMACPAVAVELAPLGGPKPAAITDSDYQAQVANALAAALLAWRSEAPQP
jgi:N-acetylmuramoyl-L-alanine amidase